MKPLAAALLLALAAAAQAAEAARTVEASGRAAARDQAKQDALRACVEQVAGGLVTAGGDADQARLLAERITGRAASWVRRFQLLEDRQDGAAWIARVRCEVAEGKLEDELLAAGIAHLRPGLPRLWIHLVEQGPGAPAPAGPEGGPAEQAFAARLARCGFVRVDPRAAPAPAAQAGPGAGLDAAVEAARRAGAEVLVIGTVVARPAGEVPVDGAGLRAVVATAAVRALRVDGGEALAAVELSAPPGRGFDPAAAGREALAEAGRAAAREVFARVGAAWARGAGGLRHVAVAVRGVDDYARLAAFKAALIRSVPGVQAVQERALEAGRAELTVALAGTGEGLATELATRRFPGFSVKVRRVAAEALELELGPGAGGTAPR